jgi:hypothetical protein
MADYGSGGGPRLTPESIRARVLALIRADLDRILIAHQAADFGISAADVAGPEGRRYGWELGAAMPAVNLREVPLIQQAMEIDRAIVRHRQTQALIPEQARRGVTLSYLLDVHVPPDSSRSRVELRDLTPPEERP